ncbi:MAG: formyltetrahydrofolate deformylase [Acidobacteriota bacterium]
MPASSSSAVPALVFLVQSADQPGLVARISSFFHERGFNIVHLEQHADPVSSRLFLRIALDQRGLRSSRAELTEAFGALADALDLTWSAHFADHTQRVALLVTKASHCLYDLLVRWKEGELPCDIPLIIGNHPDLEPVANAFRVPFHCLPVTKATKPQQEAEIDALLRKNHIDLVVLARYMQILTADFTDRWTGRIINIHHAFLPAFQGARPYHRAYERGVKLIGATAHYVIAALDEGPIIEQDVVRVTHEDAPQSLIRIGRDVERVVLARAVQAHLEHRIVVDGHRTVVFGRGS